MPCVNVAPIGMGALFANMSFSPAACQLPLVVLSACLQALALFSSLRSAAPAESRLVNFC